MSPPSGAILVRVVGFSVALTLIFALVANLLPQVQGEAPKEEEVDLGELTMDDFVALGERIFKGKGTCTLCHNDRGRAPDLLALNVVATAEKRLRDERYQGAAGDAPAYLRESMVEPGTYVVKGFGKKGTHDTESPMPAVDKPPIQLSEVELDAVIAFLQAKDGNEVTVSLPQAAPVETTLPKPAAGERVSAKNAKEAVTKFGCLSCHSLLGSTSPVGPPLDDVGARLTVDQIRQSILDPDTAVAEGFAPGIMPGDFGERMTARELEMIVELLAQQKG